ncbi:MAG: ABC transporter ATP-binding protein [Acidimicrobiales bacterium]
MTAVPPLLAVDGLVKSFPVTRGILRRRRGDVRAVDRVSFTIEAGRTLGLVGESGCGKSTLARCLLRLVEPSAGRVRFGGEDVRGYGAGELRRLRRRAQIIFQDPFATLNPRMTVRDLVAEPLRAHRVVATKAEARRRGDELLEMVGLTSEQADRYPRQLSGGQRQRVNLARAISCRPRLLILDEPVAALDVSIAAQILNLLADLQAELGVAYLFISHDLSLVRHVAHRVAVMYLGAIVELADADEIFRAPQHPYSQALLSAAPLPDPIQERRRRRIPLPGEVPTGFDVPSGCRFRTRCFKVQPVCAEREPPLEPVAGGDHCAACHFAAPLRVL